MWYADSTISLTAEPDVQPKVTGDDNFMLMGLTTIIQPK